MYVYYYGNYKLGDVDVAYGYQVYKERIEEGEPGEFSCNETCWIVPNTVDPLED